MDARDAWCTIGTQRQRLLLSTGMRPWLMECWSFNIGHIIDKHVLLKDGVSINILAEVARYCDMERGEDVRHSV